MLHLCIFLCIEFSQVKSFDSIKLLGRDTRGVFQAVDKHGVRQQTGRFNMHKETSSKIFHTYWSRDAQ